jgi:spore coat protein A
MKKETRRILRIFAVSLVLLAMMLPLIQMPAAALPASQTPMDPTTIPKYVNQLNGPPPVFKATKIWDPVTSKWTDSYTILASEFTQQILPAPLPKTKVWGYGGLSKDALTGANLGFIRNSPSPSFEVTRGVPTNIAWVNGIYTKYLFAVDPTLDWANPNNFPAPQQPVNAPAFPPGYLQAQYPAAIVTHVHGGEQSAKYDGLPFAWWTWNGLHGPDYNTYKPTSANAAVFHYDNTQSVGTVWYHDHAMGLTRSNVYSGLAGFYFIRDPADTIAPLLPSGKYEVPLAIQDRNFYMDGSLMFPSDPAPNPEIHPYWVPEFFGSTIMVNGLVWPNMNVDQGQYMFRVLDGSNARVYHLYFSNNMPFTVIASDDAYLRAPIVTTDLTIGPGERYVILADFTGIPAGTQILLLNDANAPYPDGDPVDPNTNGQIMQFTVNNAPGFVPKTLPTILNPALTTYPSLSTPILERNITLKEWFGPNGPQMVTVDGQQYSSPISELPAKGTTELWRIIDDTGDAHPMHWHLVNVQVVSRQAFNITNYDADWMALNGDLPFNHPTLNVNLENYLEGPVIAPTPLEEAWKDTVLVLPSQVTTFLIRFAPTDGTPNYTFNVSEGPPYVWHCHIVDHEDQEMIRPYRVV